MLGRDLDERIVVVQLVVIVLLLLPQGEREVRVLLAPFTG
jgi:hypothetical protein